MIKEFPEKYLQKLCIPIDQNQILTSYNEVLVLEPRNNKNELVTISE